MRRADRLFDILQTLRVATRPMTAATIAERLEVAVRTVYRDIATLQARRIPIEGEAGIGYVLRAGFDLPPLMVTPDEVDAITVGARRLRDPGLPAHRFHDQRARPGATRHRSAEYAGRGGLGPVWRQLR